MKTLKKKKKERKKERIMSGKKNSKNSKNSNTDIPINQHQSTINTHCPPLVSMILLIDSYDSFTNNLAHLLKRKYWARSNNYS